MNIVLDYTYLPWEDQDIAGKICWICLVAGVLFLLVTQIIRRTKWGYDLHGAPFVTMEMTVLALLLNTAAFMLFFWYAALVASLLFSLAFFASGRGMQNKIYYEEKEGRWGLCPALRTIRGEMFADLPIPEQLEHKKKVEQTFRKLNAPLFFLLTILIPFAIVVLLYFCGLGYTFVPHAL